MRSVSGAEEARLHALQTMALYSNFLRFILVECQGDTTYPRLTAAAYHQLNCFHLKQTKFSEVKRLEKCPTVVKSMRLRRKI